MCSIVLPIYSIHANNIYKGIKKYEYRHKRPNSFVDYILLYETSPKQCITGLIKVQDIIEGSPAEIWNISKKHSGISRDYYDEYYSDRDNAVAYKIDKVCKFDRQLALSDINLKSTPQSFSYLEEPILENILSIDSVRSKIF